MSESAPFPSADRRENLQNVPVPMVTINREGIITFANRQALVDFDENIPETIENRHFNEFLSQEDQNRLPQIFKEFVSFTRHLGKGGKTAEIKYPEVKIKTVSGKERYVRLTPRLIIGEGIKRRIIGSEIYISDITDEVRQRALAEAIKIVGESDLSKEDILRKIRSILKTVVPHDTANLMFFDDIDNPETLTVEDEWGYKTGDAKTVQFSKLIRLENRPLLQRMLVTRKPISIADTKSAEDYVKTGPEMISKSWIGAPLCIDIDGKTKVIGFLNLNSTKEYLYDEKDAETLQQFTGQIAYALKRIKKYEEKSDLAFRDTLTGVFNRGYLNIAGTQMVNETLRTGNPLSVLMTDTDRFKLINDNYGHPKGDEVMQFIGNAFMDSLRTSDVITRYGGDEFTAILPDSDLADAFTSAQRIRNTMELRPAAFSKDGDHIFTTLSIGIASLNNSTDQDFNTLVDRADTALSIVKKFGGKNAIGVHIPETLINGNTGRKITRPEQVVVFKKQKTDKKHIKSNIPVLPDFPVKAEVWDVTVYQNRTEKSGFENYTSANRYRVYVDLTESERFERTSRKYIYRLEGDDENITETEYPVATVATGLGAYFVEPNSEYQAAIDKEITPNDSFVWINILYPQKKSWPNDDKFIPYEMY